MWDGIYGFSPLSKKTRKSNRLQMSLQRQSVYDARSMSSFHSETGANIKHVFSGQYTYRNPCAFSTNSNVGVWHLQTADCRPQIADCKLKDTKNLPNKGDTIKNITSCESEKVAWEQGWYFCAKLHWPHFQDAVGYSSPTRLFIDSSDISLIALILYSSLIIVNW